MRTQPHTSKLQTRIPLRGQWVRKGVRTQAAGGWSVHVYPLRDVCTYGEMCVAAR